jgi:hypothetical protein
MYGSSRTQNLKEGAYLDYFKHFANNALDTTRKLESTFQDEFTDDIFANSQHMFKLIKQLLSSYEVLILGSSFTMQKSTTHVSSWKFQILEFASLRSSFSSCPS